MSQYQQPAEKPLPAWFYAAVVAAAGFVAAGIVWLNLPDNPAPGVVKAGPAQPAVRPPLPALPPPTPATAPAEPRLQTGTGDGESSPRGAAADGASPKSISQLK